MLKLTRFLERLPEETAIIKLLVGDSRKQTTVAIFVIEPHEPKIRAGDIIPEKITWEEAEELIMTEADNNGYGVDHTHLRINAKSITNQHLKSLTLSRRKQDHDELMTNGEQSQSIMHLTNGLLQLTREVKNCLGIVTDSLAHREAVMGEMFQELLEAKRDVAEAEANTMALDVAIQAEEARDQSGFQQEALGQLGEIVKTVMGSRGNRELSQEEALGILKSWMVDKPEIIDAAFQDEEISAGIMSRIMGMSQE